MSVGAGMARAGYASRGKAISDLDTNKRNLVQVQLGILSSAVDFIYTKIYTTPHALYVNM